MASFAIAGSSFSCVEASEAMQTQDRSDSRGWAAGVWTIEKRLRRDGPLWAHLFATKQRSDAETGAAFILQQLG